MGDDVSAPLLPAPQKPPVFRRRNAISTSLVVPTRLSFQPHLSSGSGSTSTTSPAVISSANPKSSSSSESSPSSPDFELFSIKAASYTSLKDLIPTVPVNSPKVPKSPAQSGSEISIRNHLVKQAAWAYLQPMSTSPDSTCDSFLNRLWAKLNAFFSVLGRHVFQMSTSPDSAGESFLNRLWVKLDPFSGVLGRHVFQNITRAVNWMFRSIGLKSSA